MHPGPDKSALIERVALDVPYASLLGIRNPWAPSIEWNKHQPPGVWARLLENAGFRDPRIRWTPFGWGSTCAVGAFFRTSHFTVTAVRAGEPASPKG